MSKTDPRGNDIAGRSDGLVHFDLRKIAMRHSRREVIDIMKPPEDDSDGLELKQ